MLRRTTYIEEPMSRLAAWSLRLAWFAVAVAALSVIVLRSGILEIEPALATFAAALVFAALAVLLAFAAYVSIWHSGRAGLGRAISGMFLGIILLAYPSYLAYRGSKLPPITDITTDTVNPPSFDVLARLRPRGSNDYPGAAVAALQHKGYPDIGPLQVDAQPKLVYDIALNLASKRKWHVVDAVPPVPGRRNGEIEAVARTPIMGFRDDVVLRISPDGTGTRVDMRSASRYGLSDFGTNAARIQAMLDDIDDAVSNAPEPRPGPEKPEKKPQTRRQPAKR
jgi:Protein of unknown function (DUF1499)